MNANLLFKLAESLQMMHCTYFLPYQSHQDPIDYLLQTSSAPKKWKINLNYDNSGPGLSGSGGFSANSSTKSEPHLRRLISESAQKIYCLKIPLKFNQNSAGLVQHIKHPIQF